jgi:hypothetical protein
MISMLIVALTVIFAVVQASNLSFSALRSKVLAPKTYVEIVAGELQRHTHRIEWKIDPITRWDSKFDL